MSDTTANRPTRDQLSYARDLLASVRKRAVVHNEENIVRGGRDQSNSIRIFEETKLGYLITDARKRYTRLSEEGHSEDDLLHLKHSLWNDWPQTLLNICTREEILAIVRAGIAAREPVRAAPASLKGYGSFFRSEARDVPTPDSPLETVKEWLVALLVIRLTARREELVKITEDELKAMSRLEVSDLIDRLKAVDLI